MKWRGVVADGLGECAEADLWPEGWFPGSLNLTPVDEPLLGRVRHLPPSGFERRDDWGGVPTICTGSVRGIPVVVFAEFPHVVELVARQHLRSELGVTNGDVVSVDVDWGAVLC